MLSQFFDTERLIHSVKTAIAVMIGIVMAKTIGTPADQWVVITIIVVMCAQLYVGSVIQKAALRLLGTLIGCLIAAFALVTAGNSNTVILATITLASFVFSYFATAKDTLSYAGTLGAVTTAIIMMGNQPTLLFAGQRFLEISGGILIATLVSQFILPIHASNHLRRAQARTLEQLRDYYTKAMMTPPPDEPTLDYQELDEVIVKSLLKQRVLAKESSTEPLHPEFSTTHFMQSLYCEREILRCITFMHYALTHIKSARDAYFQSPGAHFFNEIIIQSLNALIQALENPGDNSLHIHIPSLTPLKDELQKNLEKLSREDLIHVDGLLFCAEILLQSLAKLAEVYHVRVYEAEKEQGRVD